MKANLSDGIADSTSADKNAFAPGTTEYSTPASLSFKHTVLPGSEITGIPASEITATRLPSRAAEIIFSAASRSLNL